jgi:hypothetical protein
MFLLLRLSEGTTCLGTGVGNLAHRCRSKFTDGCPVRWWGANTSGRRVRVFGALRIPPLGYIVSRGPVGVTVSTSQGSRNGGSRGQGKHRIDGGPEALWGSMILKA